MEPNRLMKAVHIQNRDIVVSVLIMLNLKSIY